MPKLTSHVVTLSVGLAVGMGGVAIAANDRPQAAAASDSQVIRELRTLNRNVQMVNKTLGGYTNVSPQDSIADDLDALRDVMNKVCRNTGAIDGASPLGCY